MTTTEEPTDAAGRLEWLSSTAELLWPGSGGIRLSSGDPAFWLLPNANQPRLLVPSGSRRAAAAAVRHYGEQLTLKGRVKTAGLAAALRTGAAQRLLAAGVSLGEGNPTDGVAAYLSEQLGRPVLVSLHLSPPRANRKPVLQLLSPDGEVIAFAKVGVDERTAALVLREGVALRRLNGVEFTTVRVPPVLHHDSWNGLEILVLGALPVWGRRESAPGRLRQAIREISQVVPAVDEPLSASSYLADLQARLASCPSSAALTSLEDLLRRLVRQAGASRLSFGAWHGDFTPWNSAPVGGQLLVWDWERFAGPVPIGYDALHHGLQSAAVQQALPLPQAALRCIEQAEGTLTEYGVEATILTAALYLVELGTRYLGDEQAAAGGHGGRIEEWLVPALATAVAEL
ncbi:MAG TPA: hypothetical protein VGD34_12355 [Kribbella sp.]